MRAPVDPDAADAQDAAHAMVIGLGKPQRAGETGGSARRLECSVTSAVSTLAGGSRLPAVSFLARLPAALCPTGTLLVVTARSGIGTAGLVAGALWVGQAIGGPLIGRLSDRRGQHAVVLTAALSNAVALLLLVAAVLTDRPPALQAACSALAGLTVPQIGPLSRSRWVRLAEQRADGQGLIGAALSMDATLDEISFVAGPALAGLLAFTLPPVSGLLLAAALIAVFGTLFALHPSGSPAVAASRTPAGPPPPLPPVLRPLLALALLQGMFFGSANAGVNAMAASDPGVAGLVWATMGVSSALVGLLVTARPGPLPLPSRLRRSLAVQAVLAPGLLLVHTPSAAALVLVLVGTAVAPTLIALFSLAASRAPAQRMAEVMTWLGSALIIGQGLAAVAAGQLAHRFGCTASFGLSCAATVLALVVVLLSRIPAPGPPPPRPVADPAASGSRGPTQSKAQKASE